MTYIKITPDSIESSSDLNFQEALRLLSSAVLQLMNGTLEFAENEEDRDALKDSLYDMSNRAFTAVLEGFDPTKTQNEDLDINAVIALQDDIVNEALKTIKEHNPRRYQRIKREMKANQDRGKMPHAGA